MDGDDRHRAIRVVLTRQAEDNRSLAHELEALGLEVLQAPCLDIAYVQPTREEAEALPHLEKIDAALFSSKNGVRGFFNWLEREPVRRSERQPNMVGAVGPGTARELELHGWRVDLVPSLATGAELASMMLTKLAPMSRILNVRGDTSRAKAARILGDAGHEVFCLTVYHNREPRVPFVPAPIDIVVYTSPLAAKRFLAANPHAASAWPVAIGPTTAASLQDRGLEPFMSHSTEDEDIVHAIKMGLKRR